MHIRGVKKYVKKPVTIEAIQYTGDNQSDVHLFMKKHAVMTHDKKLEIETLEGTMTASIGDFIIKGIQGEFYPCKPDIFRETYMETAI